MEQPMSIFGNIASAIFGSSAQATPASASSTAGTAPGAPAASAPVPASSLEAAAPGAPAAGAPAKPMSSVDVAVVMDQFAAASKEDLDWRRSIVDLMKLLKLDSSLKARKELATELNYAGNMKDTAAMNIWLHKQVMIKLGANGGNVPPELRD